MSARPQDSTDVAWRRGRRRDRGLVLLELALVLLVAALGLGLGLTLAGRAAHRRNCDNYIRDLRVFSAAFADYFQQEKTWPPGGSADVPLPAQLATTLNGTNWFRGSPLGGNYGWVAPFSADAAGGGVVTLTAFSPSFPLKLDRADLLYIDGQLDDGNLATGRFRTGFNGWPVYLVEAAKR